MENGRSTSGFEIFDKGLESVEESLISRFGRRPSEIIVLDIQGDSEKTVITQERLRAIEITHHQPLFLVLNPDRKSLNIMCVEPAASYGQSDHPQRDKIYDIYRFAPKGEGDHGILFAREILEKDGRVRFALRPTKFNQADEKTQISFHRELFPDFWNLYRMLHWQDLNKIIFTISVKKFF